MKKLIFTSAGIVVVFLFILSSFSGEVISKPSVITYCYRAYSNELYCISSPLDCDCFTVAGQ